MDFKSKLEAVRQQMEAAKLSVTQVCREAGLARSTWDRWLRGETEPNFKSWRAVEEAVARLSAVAEKAA